MEHDHDVPGAGPTRILALEEGDAPEVPHEVEAQLRKPAERRPSRFTRAELLEQFRDDYDASVADRPGCLRDWQQVHPELAIDLEGIAQTVEYGPKPRPKVAASVPVPDEVGEPTPGAIAVLAMTAALTTMVLGICRLFSVDIGVVWILAPVWGSALAVALAGAVTTAIAWAERNAR